MNGIPPEVTARAEHLARLAARGEDLVAACAVMSETEVAELQNGVSFVFRFPLFFRFVEMMLSLLLLLLLFTITVVASAFSALFVDKLLRTNPNFFNAKLKICYTSGGGDVY